VQAEQFELEGLPGETTFLSPVQIRIEPPAELAREVTITSFSGTSVLDLTLADTLLQESNNLAVTEVSFYKPIENIALPTILSGEIRIAEVDKPLARTLPIAAGEALDLTAVDRLALEKISIRPEGISLRLSGLVSSLETGKSHDLRNPLRLEWFWCNYRTLLIGLGIAFLGLAMFLPPKIRERIFEVLKIAKGF